MLTWEWNRHGKDNKLVVWKLNEGNGDVGGMSTVLPVEGVEVERRAPWVVGLLEVNTLNFCAFALCDALVDCSDGGAGAGKEEKGVLIAVPNALSSEAVSC